MIYQLVPFPMTLNEP